LIYLPWFLRDYSKGINEMENSFEKKPAKKFSQTKGGNK